MDERRQSPRFNVTSEINGRMKSTMIVRILDLSLNGMLMESTIGLAPNGTCEVVVLAPSGERRLRAVVRRCRAEAVQCDDGVKILYYTGLEFPSAGEDGRSLTDLITEICTVDGPIMHEGTEVEAEVLESGTEGEECRGFKFAM